MGNGVIEKNLDGWRGRFRGQNSIVVDLFERIEETCELAKNELSKVQARNHKYYNRSTRERKLRVGDSVLLLLPTEQQVVFGLARSIQGGGYCRRSFGTSESI